MKWGTTCIMFYLWNLNITVMYTMAVMVHTGRMPVTAGWLMYALRWLGTMDQASTGGLYMPVKVGPICFSSPSVVATSQSGGCDGFYIDAHALCGPVLVNKDVHRTSAITDSHGRHSFEEIVTCKEPTFPLPRQRHKQPLLWM